MNTRRIMAAFPSAADEQVTLANWRQHPFNEWAFRNVRELLPTANIARSTTSAPLSFATRYLDDVGFANSRGETIGISEALRASHTDGIVVSHRGQVAFEWYAHGLTPDAPHLIFSVSKSAAGTLGGILADHGKLDPDAPVTRYIPEMEGSVYGGGCTVRHLLDMSVGIRFDEDYMARDGDVMNYRRSTGWEPPDPTVPPTNLRDYLRTLRPNGTPHGQTFHYVSTNTDVLGWVYERACGVSYAKILAQYLWQPMGAEHDAYIAVDSRGAARVAGGICATLRDLARFGETVRNHGRFNGRQIVPSQVVEDIARGGDPEKFRPAGYTTLPGASYRNQWWISHNAHGAYMARGVHGQGIYVDPKAEMVIARYASHPMAGNAANDPVTLPAYMALAKELMAGG